MIETKPSTCRPLGQQGSRRKPWTKRCGICGALAAASQSCACRYASAGQQFPSWHWSAAWGAGVRLGWFSGGSSCGPMWRRGLEGGRARTFPQLRQSGVWGWPAGWYVGGWLSGLSSSLMKCLRQDRNVCNLESFKSHDTSVWWLCSASHAKCILKHQARETSTYNLSVYHNHSISFESFCWNCSSVFAYDCT